MTSCLLVSTLANTFATEIERLSETPITLGVSSSAHEALAEYNDETVLFGSPGIIAEILPYLPQVAWVQSSWAGVTPLIDSPRRDYLLTGVKGVFGPQMAEYVFGYMLAHELRIMQRASAQSRNEWDQSHSGNLTGKTLGIMGTGSIGQHIAQVAACLGLSVRGLSRSGKTVPGFPTVCPVTRIDDFLTGCDYVVSTLPNTSETSLLLNAKTLAALPNHAYFINVGRSNVADEVALMDALENGKLAGATLDVFAEEPVPNHSKLWTTKNLMITAHIAAISHPLLIVPIFLENYNRYVTGQSLQYVVDFERGY